MIEGHLMALENEKSESEESKEEKVDPQDTNTSNKNQPGYAPILTTEGNEQYNGPLLTLEEEIDQEVQKALNNRRRHNINSFKHELFKK